MKKDKKIAFDLAMANLKKAMENFALAATKAILIALAMERNCN